MFMPTFDKLTDAERAELLALEASADAAIDATITALQNQRAAYRDLPAFASRVAADNADAARDALELESEVEYRLEALEEYMHDY